MTTKYKIHIATLTITLLLLSACSKDFLNIAPQDQLTTGNFYQNESQIKAATASLYGAVWFDFASRFFWLTGDLMSGNLYYTYLGSGEGNFLYFSVNEGNTNLSGAWKSLYRVVSYSNDVMNTMPPIASGHGVSTDVINHALGEAHFMRASAYFILAEYWGDVPIVENNSQLIASNDLNLPKNTKASVYEFIRRDLEFAAANLPTSDQPGRVTQWSAKGMLAKLHLTMASNLSDANSAQNFTKAQGYAADVISNSGLSLMADYADLFKVQNNNNTESLFALQWIPGTYGQGNGVPTDWARNSIVTGISQAYGAGKSFSYDFVSNVEAGDLRRSSIYMTKGDFYPDIDKKDGGYHYNYVTVDGSGTQIETAAPVLNSIKKYVIGSADDTGNQVVPFGTGQDQYMLRLADVYLIYAEATLGAGASTADGIALSYFNRIRARAGLATKGVITFEDILKERRVEFAGEMMYWFDLKRYYYRDPSGAINNISAQTRLFQYIQAPGSSADPNTMAFYTLQTYASDGGPTPISVDAIKAQMILPIPASEVVNDPNLATDATAVEYVFH